MAVIMAKLAQFNGSSYGKTCTIQRQFLWRNMHYSMAVLKVKLALFNGSSYGETCTIQWQFLWWNMHYSTAVHFCESFMTRQTRGIPYCRKRNVCWQVLSQRYESRHNVRHTLVSRNGEYFGTERLVSSHGECIEFWSSVYKRCVMMSTRI